MAERKYRDIEIGERFYSLTVEGFGRKPGSNSRQLYYYCRCDCGNITYVRRRDLLNGVSKSCMCRIWAKSQMIGKVYGKLTVLEIDNDVAHGSGKHAYYRCQCECGNVASIRGSDMRNGSIIDCGCGRGRRMSEGRVEDISGATFGHLCVIERDWSHGTNAGHHARWMCKCNLCGSIESISSQILTRYGKDRCRKCSGMSNGEKKICDLLDDMNIDYDNNSIYKDCIYPETNARLRFDFVVHTDPEYIIEFDGIQHFKEIKPWELKIDLEGRQSRDAFKDRWCADNNVPLIRIPYTHLSKICNEDLLLESSKFVVII